MPVHTHVPIPSAPPPSPPLPRSPALHNISDLASLPPLPPPHTLPPPSDSHGHSTSTNNNVNANPSGSGNSSGTDDSGTAEHNDSNNNDDNNMSQDQNSNHTSNTNQNQNQNQQNQRRSNVSNRLRMHSHRLRVLKMRSQFEQSLLTLLTLNIIYLYYIDHKLVILIIRTTQLFRLLWFQHSSPNSQRSTAVLLLVSNLPILIIHKLLFSGRPKDIEKRLGDMLFINFIGPEPKTLTKVLVVDLITIVLQAFILQCRWDPYSIHLISAFPLPVADTLIAVDDDPFLSRPSNQHPTQNQTDPDQHQQQGQALQTSPEEQS